MLFRITETAAKLPAGWPCQWNTGIIPYVFDFFALSPKRLINLVTKAHMYIQERSCLIFKELNPKVAASVENYTYLFYSYSEVLESCCFKYYARPEGRRLVLITPTCFLQVDVAHATLHGLGLEHARGEPFSDAKARAVMFPHQCPDMKTKLALLEVNSDLI